MQQGGFGNDPTMNNVTGLFGEVLSTVYAVILLIMMVLPSVRAAFAGRQPADEFDRDRYDAGGYDDERRRDRWDY